MRRKTGEGRAAKGFDEVAADCAKMDETQNRKEE
jgi:hypothetical protein